MMTWWVTVMRLLMALSIAPLNEAMTVYRPKGRKTYRYDFEWRGRRYLGNTGQVTQLDAELWEKKLRLQLRQEAGGIAAPASELTPRFEDWAEIYIAHKRDVDEVERVDEIESTVFQVLQFFGAKPAKDADPDAPYHDLRLGDLIIEPAWIDRFDDWMRTRAVRRGPDRIVVGRGIGARTRNGYRSALSGMYRVAMLPKYRKSTRVSSNPFLGIERDRPARRMVSLTVEDMRRWIDAAAPHIRLAVTIAALAPKLRKSDILKLRWDQHFDHELSEIRLRKHKTSRFDATPRVMPISTQLRRVLVRARAMRRSAYVINFYDRSTNGTKRYVPVKDIKKGVNAALRRANLKVGLKTPGGVTFHAIRHTMSTLLAKLAKYDGQRPLSEPERQAVMGHADIQTTQIYTHLAALEEGEHLERLANVVPLEDLVFAAAGKPAGPEKNRRKKPEHFATRGEGSAHPRKRRQTA